MDTLKRYWALKTPFLIGGFVGGAVVKWDLLSALLSLV